MCRKSHGNTRNESKNLDQWFKAENDRVPSVEIVRSTPAPPTSFSKTFAEAVLMASIKTQERMLVTRHFEKTPLQLDTHLDHLSSASSVDSNDADLLSLPSPVTGQVMTPLPADKEGEVSIQLMSLNIERSPASSEDSFSSNSASSYNKGAQEFMKLVEIALAEQTEPKKLEFSDLVIQMMDLGLGQKVATPDDIPGKLN